MGKRRRLKAVMAEIDESETAGVRKVCQDFRVREDGALAYRLQEEEIDQHYKRNRQESRKIQDDVRTAKITYLEEVKNARLLPEQELPDMEETDKWLARELQDRLQSEEEKEYQQRKSIETEDERLAREFQEREERQARQLERERLQRSISETEDERLARQMQEREAIRAERARQFRREQELIEQRDRQLIHQALASVQMDDEPPPVPRRGAVLNGSVDVPTRGFRGNETRSNNRSNMGDGAVVRLPEHDQWQQAEPERGPHRIDQGGRRDPDRRVHRLEQGGHPEMQRRTSEAERRKKPEQQRSASDQGGRLEPDRIVMADGTAIALFDNEHDRERALKKNRERQDEEFARMLQEEENRKVKGSKHSEQDRMVAIEYQDRELAKQLQRKEYVKYQKLRREKELTRAQTVPKEGGAEAHEGRRRLPSYEEATHRSRLPDLLPDDLVAQADQEFAASRPPRVVRSNTSPGPSIERSHHRPSRARGHPSSLERRYDSGEPEVVWTPRDYQHSSPLSSLERSGGTNQSRDHAFHSSHSSNSSSSGHHFQGHSPSQHVIERPGTSDAREDVWERFEDESLCRNRNVMKSYATGPSVSSTLESNDSHEGRRVFTNIAESIDPTFVRGQSFEGCTSDTICDPSNSSVETTPKKAVPIVPPQRRRSSSKKKNQENCKQQ